ncbi:MAG: P-loop NTPase fold protein [Thermoflexales bacterium]
MTSSRRSQATSLQAGLLLSLEQAETLGELLAMLDHTSEIKRIALIGPSSSGKSALLSELTRSIARPRRTPSRRRVVCSMIDAAALPGGVQPWQHLLLSTLEAMRIQLPLAGILNLIHELKVLIAHEQAHPDSSTLGRMAFVHRFRTTFEGLVLEAIARQNAVLLVAVDHLDRASSEDALQLLEASEYFLKAPFCATLVCVNADRLSEDEAFAHALLRWMTSRLEMRAPQAVLRKPTVRTERLPESLANMPALCAQILLDALGSDSAALDRASKRWLACMDALTQRDITSANGALMAKLCALRELSPNLFDAMHADVEALLALERAARNDEAASGSPYAYLFAALDHQPRVRALLRSAPGFAGSEPRQLAAALRQVGSSTLSTADTLPMSKGSRFEMVSDQTLSPFTLSIPRLPPIALPAGLWAFLSVSAGAFALDRLTKMGGLTHMIPPSNQPSILQAGAGIAADLIGLALALLTIGFFGSLHSTSRATALGLLIAGLAGDTLDRMMAGTALNWLTLGDVVTFNIAHVSSALGALLLLINLIRSLSSAHD